MGILETKINEFQLQLDPIKDTQHVTDFNISIKKRLEKIDKDTLEPTPYIYGNKQIQLAQGKMR